MQGLWAMLVATDDADGFAGAGVLYVDEDGRAFGGDSGHSWHGTVKVEAGRTAGSLFVRRFAEGVGSLFVGMDDRDSYTVDFSGGYAEDSFHAGLWVVDLPTMKAAVHLKRVA